MRSCVKNEYIQNLIKLKRQEESMDRTLEHFLENLKSEPEILKVTNNERSSRMLERKKMENLLRTSVQEVTNYLKEITLSIEDLEEGKKIDVEGLKKKLTALATKIREFKKESPMEILANEELELDRELHEFYLNLEKYENQRISSNGKRNAEITVSNEHGYKGAKDFDALVAKTGHTGNWSEADHLFFLKVRKTSPNVPAMVAAIRKKCPDLTAERIVNHEAWYKTYLELREKQKNAIREWRENRGSQVLRQEKIEVKKTSPKNIERHCEKIYAVVEKRNLVKSTENEKSSEKLIKKKIEYFTGDAEEKREMIKRWREEREMANSFENEKLKSEIESRKLWRENRRLARARAIKSAIIAYKEKQIVNAMTNSSDTEFERKSPQVPSMIKSFRRQDEAFLKRKKALLERKKSCPAKTIRREILTRSNSEQSTLLNPTKIWLQRCKLGKDHDSGSREILFVKDIPKLGTPNRKNFEPK